MNGPVPDRSHFESHSDLPGGLAFIAQRRPQVLRCPICDTTIEVLEQWSIELICCGREMEVIRSRSDGPGSRSHAPVVEADRHGVRVRVGAHAHPMTEEHGIAWIEVIADGQCSRQFLHPGQAPEAFFAVRAERLVARAFCNVHGLWSSEVPEGIEDVCAHSASTKAVNCLELPVL